MALALSVIALTQAYGYLFIPSIVAKCRVDATLGNPSFLASILAVSVLVAAGLLVRSLLESGGRGEGQTDARATQRHTRPKRRLNGRLMP